MCNTKLIFLIQFVISKLCFKSKNLRDPLVHLFTFFYPKLRFQQSFKERGWWILSLWSSAEIIFFKCNWPNCGQLSFEVVISKRIGLPSKTNRYFWQYKINFQYYFLLKARIYYSSPQLWLKVPLGRPWVPMDMLYIHRRSNNNQMT